MHPMKRGPLVLTFLVTACGGGAVATEPETDGPEIGMFAVQSPHQWQLERETLATRKLTRVTPTSLVFEFTDTTTSLDEVQTLSSAIVHDSSSQEISGTWELQGLGTVP